MRCGGKGEGGYYCLALAARCESLKLLAKCLVISTLLTDTPPRVRRVGRVPLKFGSDVVLDPEHDRVEYQLVWYLCN